ncbi:MAG TPA: efflux RND transporter periplasmic adaptor subunit [Verrucomicrobiae bacterium]|nr:efflux RND transporter periplasmic adaptor subunit [Verrucomicrobiae bacterium]
MQRFLKAPVVAIVLLALAGGVGFWRWRARNEHKWLFRTALVNRADIVATINATGTIEPVEVVDIGAQVAGLVTSFGQDKNGKTIDYGSIVEEGGILAKIDESVYAADLAVAKAQLEEDIAGEVSAAANVEQMKAKLVQADADWKRTQDLVHSQLLPLSTYDSTKASYEVAKASVAVAEAAVAQARATTLQAKALLSKAQRNLDFCTIKSPVKGVIIDRRVNIGQTVVSSLNAPSLFLLARDLTKMQIWVAVNEADVGRIAPGAPVTFACDAFPGKEFSGTVGKVRLNATMTQNVVMYTVEVNTENPENVLLPYLTANVHFVVQKESNALLVPNAALRWSPSSLVEVATEARSSKPADATERSNPSDSKKGQTPKERFGVVWLKDGKVVRPLDVKLGVSDGAATAIISDNLREGQEIVIGETTEIAQAGVQNPFLPQIRRR